MPTDVTSTYFAPSETTHVKEFSRLDDMLSFSFLEQHTKKQPLRFAKAAPTPVRAAEALQLTEDCIALAEQSTENLQQVLDNLQTLKLILAARPRQATHKRTDSLMATMQPEDSSKSLLQDVARRLRSHRSADLS